MQMKKIFLILFDALLVTSCGVGSHSVTSGKADEAGLVFFDDSSYPIEVTIDGKVTYKVDTVKDSDFKKKRNIKKTADNMIVVSPGVHQVTVRRRGEVIHEQRIFVSAGDTKVITL